MAQHTLFVGGDIVVAHTSYDHPAIPTRSMDWSAVTDAYDADCDEDGFFSTHPVGHGATEAEALADLKIQLEDIAEEKAASGQFGVGA